MAVDTSFITSENVHNTHFSNGRKVYSQVITKVHTTTQIIVLWKETELRYGTRVMSNKRFKHTSFVKYKVHFIYIGAFEIWFKCKSIQDGRELLLFLDRVLSRFRKLRKRNPLSKAEVISLVNIYFYNTTGGKNK